MVGPRGIDVVGRWKLRVLRRVRGHGSVPDVFSSPMAWAGRAFIFAGEGKFGLAMYYVGSLSADTDSGGNAIRTRDGWAVVSNDWALIPPPTSGGVSVTSFYEDRDRAVGLGLPAAAPSAAAYDAHGHRLFVVSSTGAAAVVDMRTFDVSYRALQLPPDAIGRTSTLAWAGRSSLVLSGAGSGAWSIDTGGGPPRAVDPAATGVLASTGSIVTWNRAAATGVRFYEPDGDLRFALFPSRRVSEVAVTARYAYVDAGGRYSVDLRTGTVTGPLRNRARLVAPDLLRLP